MGHHRPRIILNVLLVCTGLYKAALVWLACSHIACPAIRQCLVLQPEYSFHVFPELGSTQSITVREHSVLYERWGVIAKEKP